MISFSSLIDSFRRKRLDRQIEHLENNLIFLGERLNEMYSYKDRDANFSVCEIKKSISYARAELERLRNKRREL